MTSVGRRAACPNARERAGPVFPCGGGGNTGPAARVGTIGRRRAASAYAANAAL